MCHWYKMTDLLFILASVAKDLKPDVVASNNSKNGKGDTGEDLNVRILISYML